MHHNSLNTSSAGKHLKIGRLLLFGLLLILLILLVRRVWVSTRPPKSLWQVLKMEKEHIETISIAYDGETVTPSPKHQERLIAALDQAVFVEKTKEEAPLVPSAVLFEYVDRRVDVVVDSVRYTFMQSEETYWNEEISRMAFDKAAKEAGKKTAVLAGWL